MRAQLFNARAEAESSKAYAERLVGEKLSLLAQIKQERLDATQYKTNCLWALKYLEGTKDSHFAQLEDFRNKVEGFLQRHEDKLRKLSIEYDEELYPHMVASIAERRWLISHGLRLAAMGTVESEEVRAKFGDVVTCALARGKSEANNTVRLIVGLSPTIILRRESK